MNDKTKEFHNVCDDMLQKTFEFVSGLKRYGLFTKEKREHLTTCYNKIYHLLNLKPLQYDVIRDLFVSLFKKCGTKDMNDLLFVLYGENYANDFKNETGILQMLLNYFHPISFELSEGDCESVDSLLHCTNIHQKSFS